MNQKVHPVRLRHPDGERYIEFRWNGDRFVHQLVAGDQILQSADETEESDWPISPPVQQLSVEPIEDRDVALGVGCAGTSHWSLSVQPIEGGFHFEWACRTKVAPDRLLSTYRLTEGQQAGESWELAPVGATAEVRSGDHTSLGPEQSLQSAGTFQWAYHAVIR